MSFEILALRSDAQFQPVRSFEVFRDDETLVSSQTTAAAFDRNGSNKENTPPPIGGIYAQPLSKKKKPSLDMVGMPLEQKKIKKRVTSRKFSNESSLDMVESEERKARELNQKAKELTELPLADISMAY